MTNKLSGSTKVRLRNLEILEYFYELQDNLKQTYPEFYGYIQERYYSEKLGEKFYINPVYAKTIVLRYLHIGKDEVQKLIKQIKDEANSK